MENETTAQFESEVFPTELSEIQNRRAKLGLPEPKLARGSVQSGPAVDRGLVGLALSGGGIRSASVGLGVLQALAAKDALKHVDYVSTVSGGGLIGSTLSCVMNSPDASPVNERFPLGFKPGEVERPAVKYLRNHSRYLAPGGLLDMIRLPTMILRGILDNFAILLPFLLLAALLTEIAYSWLYPYAGGLPLAIVPVAVLILFVIAVLGEPILYWFMGAKFTWGWRDAYERLLSKYFLALVIITLLGIPALLLVLNAIDLTWQEFVNLSLWRNTKVWTGAAAAVLVLALLNLSKRLRPVAWNFSLLLIGFFGYALVFGLYLFAIAYHIQSPVLDSAAAPELETRTVGEPLRKALHTEGVVLSSQASIEPLRGAEGRSWVVADGSNTYTITRSRTGSLRLTNTKIWDGLGREWAFLAIGIIGLVYCVLFSNPNFTSPRGFFRDRLSRAFVFSVKKDGTVEATDGLKLSQLNSKDSTAPYHLINATLNLDGSDDLSLAGRKSGFFIFSRNYVGGPNTGYCSTSDIEHYDSDFNLGTAMAISGAGLAPNMGAMTIRPLVFIMSLLNLRLDYWLLNPRMIQQASRIGRARLYASVGPIYLLKEAFGHLDNRGPYINLSDGGHLENLGVYELLRRRCSMIIAVDAAEDPQYTFECLTNLIRYARIDLGIEIDISLKDLHPGEKGLSADHWVLGTINYGGNETGKLVYIKASMTGVESEPVLAYKASHPLFPQESSSNQFFTEAQFEAYRELGEFMAESMLARLAWPAKAAAAAR